ncbi:MAG: hypothetical protein K6E20_01720 [Acholeplasmatales bacterium]|nr:hypothetical protein [Acholeplasmatales bacterium]
MKIIICPKCGCKVEYENKSIWEGNRELEEVNCPNCDYLLDKVFTDLNPNPKIVKSND